MPYGFNVPIKGLNANTFANNPVVTVKINIQHTVMHAARKIKIKLAATSKLPSSLRQFASILLCQYRVLSSVYRASAAIYYALQYYASFTSKYINILFKIQAKMYA